MKQPVYWGSMPAFNKDDVRPLVQQKMQQERAGFDVIADKVSKVGGMLGKAAETAKEFFVDPFVQTSIKGDKPAKVLKIK